MSSNWTQNIGLSHPGKWHGKNNMEDWNKKGNVINKGAFGGFTGKLIERETKGYHKALEYLNVGRSSQLPT